MPLLVEFPQFLVWGLLGPENDDNWGICCHGVGGLRRLCLGISWRAVTLTGVPEFLRWSVSGAFRAPELGFPFATLEALSVALRADVRRRRCRSSRHVAPCPCHWRGLAAVLRVGQAGAEILALGLLWGPRVLLEQENPLREFEGSLLGSVREFPPVGDTGPCWRDEPRRAGSAGGFCRPRPIGARISAVWPLWEPLRCRGGFPPASASRALSGTLQATFPPCLAAGVVAGQVTPVMECSPTFVVSNALSPRCASAFA